MIANGNRTMFSATEYRKEKLDEYPEAAVIVAIFLTSKYLLICYLRIKYSWQYFAVGNLQKFLPYDIYSYQLHFSS